MKKWDEVIKDALAIYLHRGDYAYFYGAKGQVLTDDVMNALWNAEPNYFKKYTAQQKTNIFNYSRGKIGLDCSGFVSKCVGVTNWSTGFINDCNPVYTDVYKGVAGSLVYTTFHGAGRHIGLDMGYGYYLHFAREGSSCELGRFKENTCAWEKSGQYKGIDYTGADNR